MVAAALLLGSDLFGSEDLVPGTRGAGPVERVGRRRVKGRLLADLRGEVVGNDTAAEITTDFDPIAGPVEGGQGVGADVFVERNRSTVEIAAQSQRNVGAQGAADVVDMHVLLLLASTVVVDVDPAWIGGFSRKEAADAVDGVADNEVGTDRLVLHGTQIERDSARLDGVAGDRLAVRP